MRNPVVVGVSWIGTYLGIILLPLLILLFYFICAVPKMMDQVEAALHDLGVPVTNVHMEHYNLV
jgi:predicted ferric reductase